MSSLRPTKWESPLMLEMEGAVIGGEGGGVGKKIGRAAAMTQVCKNDSELKRSVAHERRD